MSSYIEDAEKLLKSQTKQHFKDYINKHVEKYNTLFDICSCKCNISIKCNCDHSSRVPTAEVEFLQYQITTRLRTIDFLITLTNIQSRNTTDISESENRYETTESIS